jgi:hypothetical protein
MIYMYLLTWVGFGLLGYVPNTLYVYNMHNMLEKNFSIEELDGPAVITLGVRAWKLSNVRKGQSLDR